MTPALGRCVHAGGNDLLPRQTAIQHGTHCDCVLLAAALGLPPGAIPFDYCRNILQRRWSMTCKHGELSDTTTPTPAIDRWKDTGDMNSVLAILVKNV